MEDFLKAKKRLALEQEKLEVDRALVLEEKKHLKQLQSYQQEELDACRVKIKDLESKVDTQKREYNAQKAVVRELLETKISQRDEIARLQREQRQTEIEWKKEVNDLQAKLETQLNIQISNLETQLERCEKSYQDERMQLEAAIELLKKTDGKHGNSDDAANNHDEISTPTSDKEHVSFTSNEIDIPSDGEAPRTIGASNEKKGGELTTDTEAKQSAKQDKPCSDPDFTSRIDDEYTSQSDEKKGESVKGAEVKLSPRNTTASNEKEGEELLNDPGVEQSATQEGEPSPAINLTPSHDDKCTSVSNENKGKAVTDAEVERRVTQDETSPAPDLTPPPGDECSSQPKSSESKGLSVKDTKIQDSVPRHQSSTAHDLTAAPDYNQTEGRATQTKREERASFISNEVDIPNVHAQSIDKKGDVDPGEVEGEDEGTEASSTYGEDRMVVKDKYLLDPYGNKGVYSGEVLLSTGLPHGCGKMVYEEGGRTYDGVWRHGRKHGWGEATFSNGDVFEGVYKYDKHHGHGKYSWKDGRIYEGDFNEDKRHGTGHFIWPDGAEYVGDFLNGHQEGHGAYHFSDGGRCEGEWINGRFMCEGRGIEIDELRLVAPGSIMYDKEDESQDSGTNLLE
jgi:hypothetical protein